MDLNKVYAAVNLLKDFCESYDSVACAGCPFNGKYGCELCVIPAGLKRYEVESEEQVRDEEEIMGNTVKIDLEKLSEKLNSHFGEFTRKNIVIMVNECIVKEEAVNHPQHYQGKNECIDVIKAMLNKKEFLGFLKGNSIKYRFRSSMKNGEEDVKKAEWYESRLITEKTNQIVIPPIFSDHPENELKNIIESQENLKKSIMEKINENT